MWTRVIDSGEGSEARFFEDINKSPVSIKSVGFFYLSSRL
jgi:hypothetical protein